MCLLFVGDTLLNMAIIETLVLWLNESILCINIYNFQFVAYFALQKVMCSNISHCV